MNQVIKEKQRVTPASAIARKRREENVISAKIQQSSLLNGRMSKTLFFDSSIT